MTPAPVHPRYKDEAAKAAGYDGYSQLMRYYEAGGTTDKIAMLAAQTLANLEAARAAHCEAWHTVAGDDIMPLDKIEAADAHANEAAATAIDKHLAMDTPPAGSADMIDAPECPSCQGMNTSCPEGCERDPLTGELGSADAPSMSISQKHTVEKCAKIAQKSPDFHGTPEGCVSGWEVPAMGEVEQLERVMRIIEGALVRHGVTDFTGTLDDATAALAAMSPAGDVERTLSDAFAVSETASVGQWSASVHFGPNCQAMRAFADAVRTHLETRHD